MVPCRVPLVMGLLLASVFLAAVPHSAAAPAHTPALRIDGLGKGTTPLDGPWQFRLGDDPAWALPQTPDSGWELITTDKTWGQQGHRSYTGYAWYRKHVDFSLAPDIPPEVYLLIRHIDDVYEVYWNGQIVTQNGSMPSHASYPYSQAAQIVNLGTARNGVLAIRVWKAPLTSFDSGLSGGFASPPEAGSLAAVITGKAALDYAWLRGHQYYFGLESLYLLNALLSLLAWQRNRSQWVLLAMAIFSGMPVIDMVLIGLHLPISYNNALGLVQPVLCLQDVGLWFLLIYLLDLDTNPAVLRIARRLAAISLTASSLDGLLTLLDWSRPWLTAPAQFTDAVLTVIFTAVEMFPLVLLALAMRKRLDFARWFLASTAFLTEMLLVLRIAFSQGSRFTHWTIGDRLAAPVFFINGNAFTLQTIANTVLLIAVINAAYRYMQRTLRRQGALEREFQSARELQQVLIPETLPEMPGFAITSAYHPAQEVGGDFFQIIPLEDEFAGSALVILGDVSGKGLRAAMTVSLIVGTVRTLAQFVPSPAEFLAELNQRLWSRLQGGFTTCLALLVHRDGRCSIASAGHPAPFLNQREISLPGALPLGVAAVQLYPEREIELREGDQLTLYTDGLIEARNSSGEMFSFERLNALFASRPGAAEASEAALAFGQDDDITVLTLTRLTAHQQTLAELIGRELASA